jgi:radical SAM superfamily enzyme YgiQ (UPF0313 family)
MKVLLANAPWKVDGRQGVRAGSRWPHLKREEEEDYMPFPFFMAYAGAVLKENKINVLLIDAIADGLTDEQFMKKIVNFKPDLVLLEVSTPSLEIDLKWAKKIKEKTKAKIALAGLDMNIRKSEFLKKYNFIDYVLVGEYEYTLYDLVHHLKKKKDLKGVLGLIYRDPKNKIRVNPRRPLIENLNEMPWPLREQLPMKKYHDCPGGIPQPSVQVWASRGCPFECKFCAWPQIMYISGNYRARDPVKIVDEMEHLINGMGFKSVYFDDDTFNIGKQRMLEICEEIKKRNLNVPWAIMARADLMDEETLKAMKSAGLRAIKYGVESGAQELVNNVNKNLDLEKVKRIVKLTKDLGIKTHLTFMFGLPGETKETIQKTIEFALELDPESVQFSIAAPYPGTKYFEELDKKGQIVSKNWTDYNGNFKSAIKTEELTPEDLVEAQRMAYGIWNEHLEERRRYQNYSAYELFRMCLSEHGWKYTIKRIIVYLKKRI